MTYTREWLETALKNNPALAAKNPGILDKVAKEPKYHNKPGWLDGIYFDSQAEMERYGELQLLKLAKVIKGFRVHPVYPLEAGIKYEADFEVEYQDHIEVEDVKGFFNNTSRLKIKLFKEKYPNMPIKIIRNWVSECI